LSVPLYTTHEGHSPLVLISVHEGRHIPPQLHDAHGRPLGLGPADLARHIAVDLGVGDVTTLIADACKAHVFRVTHSRLVADLNRFADELECIAPRADGTDVLVNKEMTTAERNARLAEFYFPVLDGMKKFVADVARKLGAEPFLISMHSYARTMKENSTPKREDVCVFGYPEFGPSPKLEKFIQQLSVDNPDLVVGNNRPFSAKTPALQTSENDHRLACPVTFYNVVERDNVFNHFTVEICQDLLETEAARRRMAERLLKALAPLGVFRALPATVE
jgi:predicted N-formylglutamate amidohydrolase